MVLTLVEKMASMTLETSKLPRWMLVGQSVQSGLGSCSPMHGGQESPGEAAVLTHLSVWDVEPRCT